MGFEVIQVAKIVFFLFFCAFLERAAYSETIKFGMVDWCPYTCDIGKEKTHGIVPEIISKVFKKYGYTTEFKIVPFGRAIINVQKGKLLHALVTATYDEAPNFVFSKESTGTYNMSVFVEPSNKWKYSGVKSLRELGKPIGVVSGYDYGDERFMKTIRNEPQLFTVITDDQPLFRLLKMLEFGRISGFAANKNVLNYSLKEVGNFSELAVNAGDIGNPVPFYTAFSPNHPKSETYTKLLDEGIRGLRKSGELKDLLDKFGLKDWKK